MYKTLEEAVKARNNDEGLGIRWNDDKDVYELYPVLVIKVEEKKEVKEKKKK